MVLQSDRVTSCARGSTDTLFLNRFLKSCSMGSRSSVRPSAGLTRTKSPGLVLWTESRNTTKPANVACRYCESGSEACRVGRWASTAYSSGPSGARSHPRLQAARPAPLRALLPPGPSFREQRQRLAGHTTLRLRAARPAPLRASGGSRRATYSTTWCWRSS